MAGTRPPRAGHLLRRFVVHLSPAMTRPRTREALRAGTGAALALALLGGLLAWAATRLAADPAALVLVPPLGATAFLLFAVPNSPLAQPFSAMAGNVASGLIAAMVVQFDLPVQVMAGLSVGLSIAVMALLRAMHPPGAAVALAGVLSADHTRDLGLWFALAPVGLDTAMLVAAATVYNRLTGRVYPFRLPPERGAHGTRDPAPERRMIPTAEGLEALLGRMNLAANIGVEDLARVLVAAEDEAATQRFQALTCGAVMSRDMVTVRQATRLTIVADLFRRHRFKTLPVTETDGTFRGIVTQTDLIARARDAALAEQTGFARGLARLAAPGRRVAVAGDIMITEVTAVTPDTPVGALIPLLADSGAEAAPVVEGGRLVGLLTRSDLIAVMARQGIGGGPPIG